MSNQNKVESTESFPSKEMRFEERLFQIVFNKSDMEEGYISSENIPYMYDDLSTFLGDDPDRLLTAYTIIYEVEKYLNVINQRLKDMISERIDDENIPEGGFFRGNKRVTLQKKVNYDFSSSATIRDYDKKIKEIKSRMKKAQQEGQPFIIDPITNEHVPCARIKSVTTSVVVNTLKSREE